MDYTAPPPALYADYCVAPEIITPVKPPQYEFVHGWFEQVRSGWEEETAPLRGKPLQVLEIGSFEGYSTTWMLDYLMDHEESTLVAIDTFEGGNESAPSEYAISELEKRFWHNIRESPNARKVRQMKGFSADQLVKLRTENATFDLIYIDGSHMAIDVMQDAALSWPMLKEGGTLVFDDYFWKMYDQEYYAPNLAIVSFLRIAAPTIQWFEKNGQVWVRKTPNTDPPRRG